MGAHFSRPYTQLEQANTFPFFYIFSLVVVAAICKRNKYFVQ